MKVTSLGDEIHLGYTDVKNPNAAHCVKISIGDDDIPSLMPNHPQECNLGSEDYSWNKLYLHTINFIDLDNPNASDLWKIKNQYTNKVNSLNFERNYISRVELTYNSFSPSFNLNNTTLHMDLGSPTTRWNGIYYNTLISSSDEKLQENVEPLENSLSILEKLNVIKFQWKSSKDRHTQYGVTAQQAESVSHELVSLPNENPNSCYGTYLENMLYLAIKGIQELYAEVKELKNNV